MMRASLALLLVFAGCAKIGPLHTHVDAIKRGFIEANVDQYALECAPEQMALAKAHWEFAQLEFEQGDPRRAEHHLELARASVDAAVIEAEACRPHDRDGDGIEDEDDGCPDLAEDFDDFEDEDGCPETDNDGDGFVDGDDGCPNEPETRNGFEDDDGCPDVAPPADSDGDGIIDDVDRCPHEPELFNDYLDEDGCPDVKPQKVRITKKRIFIDEKVQFQTNSSKIKSVSHEILDQVAQVLTDYPHIRVRIEGHTDSDGSEGYNMKLSNRRAGSVLDYLTGGAKVDRSRLESIGYGETRPIDTNRTDEGKAANRRVEFHIVDGMD
jgi:outer membrane protein OmpA-like peptidoglycan-associated protein